MYKVKVLFINDINNICRFNNIEVIYFMKKIFLITIFSFGLIYYTLAEETKILIIEKKGQVDIKLNDDTFNNPKLNDTLQPGAEIITGFHSQLSLEIGKGSFVTVNQFSHVRIEKKIESVKEIKSIFTVLRGYVVAFTKNENDKPNKVILSVNKSNIEFNNAEGEVYFRIDKGTIINCYSGRIGISSKAYKIYSIGKNEMCGITPYDTIIESDYFLRRKINAKANVISEDKKIESYYDFLFIPYTSDMNLNDYSDNFRP